MVKEVKKKKKKKGPKVHKVETIVGTGQMLEDVSPKTVKLGRKRMVSG